MANIQINWTPYSPDPGDVDSVELYRSTTINNEEAFQTALDNGTAGAPIATFTDITVASTHTDLSVSADTYYYCLAAKNSGGYNVGADTPTTVIPAAGDVSGAVACVTVS